MATAKRPKCRAWNKWSPYRKCTKRAVEGSIYCEKHPDGGLTKQEAESARRTHGRTSPKIVKPRKPRGRRRSTLARRVGKVLQTKTQAMLRQRRRDRVARQRQQEKDRQKIQAAADFCFAAVNEGLISASADKVTESVDRELVQILRKKWRPFRCKWLARLSKSIDSLKKYVHGLFADLIVKVIWRRPEQVFVRQLLTHIPLPGDEQLTAAINAVRVVGVSMCVVQGIPLVDCECFKTLALTEAKKRVKKILTSAGDKWLKACEVSGTATAADGLF